jgi:HSP20 family protein
MELHDYDPYRAIGGPSKFASHATRTRQERQPDWRPVLDAFHTADDMVLRYEIPGVLPEDLHVRVDGRVLYVQGERRPPDPVPAELTMRAERTYGTFDRSIALPEGTDPTGVRARYHHGVLEIRVAHVRRPRPLDISPEIEQLQPATVDVLEA